MPKAKGRSSVRRLNQQLPLESGGTTVQLTQNIPYVKLERLNLSFLFGSIPPASQLKIPILLRSESDEAEVHQPPVNPAPTMPSTMLPTSKDDSDGAGQSVDRDCLEFSLGPDLDVDLGLDFSLGPDLDVSQRSESSEDEQLLSLQEMLEPTTPILSRRHAIPTVSTHC